MAITASSLPVVIVIFYPSNDRSVEITQTELCGRVVLVGHKDRKPDRSLSYERTIYHIHNCEEVDNKFAKNKGMTVRGQVS
jgi:hypothetical protein